MTPEKRSASRSRRPLILWLVVLWLVALAATSFWRAITLWQVRALLAELNSTMPAPMVTTFVILYALCGAALIASGVGLWQRRNWGRVSARAWIVLYMVIVQAYTWLFVRTGLLWERRWIALFLAILTTGAGVALLTWRRSRCWLGLS
jgi:hypothetical protein